MAKISVNEASDTHSSSATHSTMQKSATLSRKNLKRPTPARAKKELAAKDRAVKSALSAVAELDAAEPVTTLKPKKRLRRVVLALICSAATVAGLAAFIHFNMPNISVKVAALQSGIEATYPTHLPRGYQLTNVTSDKENCIVMTFADSDGASFTLTEEKSTWDSTALLNNYVKNEYSSNYATLREQGITIYTAGGDATWVNGGVLYKISSSGHALSKEQIRNLVVSL